MNDHILRGFCQKCQWPIFADISKGFCLAEYVEYFDKDDIHLTVIDNPTMGTHKILPVWFLSSKQMKIIQNSKELDLFWKANGKGPILGYKTFQKFDCITLMLETHPFLVARILAEPFLEKGSSKTTEKTK